VEFQLTRRRYRPQRVVYGKGRAKEVFREYMAYVAENRAREDHMARQWGLEAGGSMEDRLIEVFGCDFGDNRVVRFAPGRDRMKTKRDGLADGFAMEEMLIEIFGCVSVNSRVISLESGRERMRGIGVPRGDALASNA
jgi:hypothetical protein